MHRIMLVLFFVLAGPAAWACVCATPGSPEQAFSQAKAVFTARVVEIRKNTEGYAESVTLKVDKVWKGNPGETVPVPLPRSTCSFWDYKDGESYLIYAEESLDKSRPGELEISSCSRTKPLAQGRIETQYLDALAAGKGVTDIDKSLPNLLVTAKDPAMRAEAAGMLGSMMRGLKNTAPEGTLEALVKAARDENAEVRIAAARSLGSYNFAGNAVVKEALLALLKEGNRDVRDAGVSALMLVARGDSAVFRALADTLAAVRKTGRAVDAQQHEMALSNFARALAETQGSAADKAETVETLSSMIVEVADPYAKAGVIQHLGFQRQAARKAAPLLLYVLKVAGHDHVRQYTIRALGDIGANEAQAEVETYLKDENCYVAASAVEAVHKMNPAGFPFFFSQKALPEVKARFDKCAFEFTSSLRAIGSDAKAAEPLIAEKYAAMAPADWMRETLKTLLEVLRQ